MVFSNSFVAVAGRPFLLLVSLFCAVQGNVVIVRPTTAPLFVAPGSEVVLECRHPSSDAVEWSVNGVRIVNETHDPVRYVISRTDSDANATTRLTVKDIKIAESGTYNCSNVDAGKVASSSAEETASVKVQVVKITVDLATRGTIIAGRSFAINCTGPVNTELQWFLKGKLLTAEGDGVTFSGHPPDLGALHTTELLVLTVTSADATKHAGFYRCADKRSNAGATIEVGVVEPEVDGRQSKDDVKVESTTTADGVRLRTTVTSLVFVGFVIFAL